MTTEATGSAAAMLAGNPAGATDPAAAAQATTAATPPSTVDPGKAGAAMAANAAAAATASSAPAATADLPEWFGKLPEATRTVAEAKGWRADDPGEAFAKVTESYVNLEKLLGGSERIVVPKDPNDQAGWDKVYNRLGWPEKPDAYGIEKIEGAHAGYAKHMADALHKARTPAPIAKAIVEAHQAFVKAEADKSIAAAESEGNADMEALRQELGATFDEFIEAGKRVAARDGLSYEDIQKVESVWGTKKTLKYFGDRRAEVMEDKAPRGTLTPSFTMTPDAAKAQIASKMADPQWIKQYTHEDPKIRGPAITEMEKLQVMAAGQKP